MPAVVPPLIFLPTRSWCGSFASSILATSRTTRPQLTRGMVDRFDLVIVCHCAPHQNDLSRLWALIQHKPVIWRTYCQQTASAEQIARQRRKNGKLFCVRVSPRESHIPNFAGCDAVIRPFVDAGRFRGWHGSEPHVLTFNNFYGQRAWVSNTELYEQVVRGMEARLYGHDNEEIPFARGFLSWSEQIEAYQKARVYFALGSKPAAVTYNLIEAMMTGCPVVTWGPRLGTDTYPTYEVPYLFNNGEEIFFSDQTLELHSLIQQLMVNENLAMRVGKAGQKRVRELFSIEQNLEGWKCVLNAVMS